ncbi:DUF2461 domain-containing protein [Pseudonocardia acaciae]|uniref:DUF2461 domain-containing protein n=1 Tax=Pseudonocardia acaciae TaxID=551276 RepID=UPI00048D1F9A|nr:DUF2461 domain-containing protein [Pseudonocardia acaciae]
MGFSGFGEGLVDFYDGLEADNSKAYWTDHKPVYEQHVRAPMEALMAELEPEFGAGKVFRPYRDLRFSPDKTPYKTHCGAIVGGYYVQAGADGIMVAGGYYHMAGDQIRRYRVAVDEQRRGEDLRQRLARLAGADMTVAGDKLATRPRGVDPGHPRLELLRHRSIYAWRRWPGEELMLSPELPDAVAASWRAITPLIEWLTDHVGPSDQPRR